MMKSFRFAVTSVLLAISTSVFAVSIDQMTPYDGGSVKLSGFTVKMDISGLDETCLYSMVIWVDVWDGDRYQQNSFGASHPGSINQGVNVKYLVPDVYFANDEPTPTELHVVAKVGHLVNATHQGTYDAASGDQLRLTGIIFGYPPCSGDSDRKEYVLTVK